MYCMVVMCKCIVNGCTKRYFIIDQQIARHSVHYSECLYHPLPIYATQMIKHFLTSRISTNHDKGFEF